MKNIAIIGAGGFTGQELIRILASRPDVRLRKITSNEYAGKTLLEIFPALAVGEIKHLVFENHPENSESLKSMDFVFLATPDNVSMYWANALHGTGVKVIDISGAFRLKDKAVWEKFYGMEHTAFPLMDSAIYGLTEKYREQIKNASLIANPGCYPSSVLLPFYFLRDFLELFEESIIIDSKSGTSGAGGRKEKDSLGYSTVYENFRAYRIEAHQHQPEMEQEINNLSGSRFKVRFTPHLLPVFRGIYTVAYMKPKSLPAVDMSKIKNTVKAYLDKEPFVRFYDNPNDLQLKNVQNTNFADFSLHLDVHAGVFILLSVVDNLRKGAAGSAVQNMNIMMGAPETMGLL